MLEHLDFRQFFNNIPVALSLSREVDGVYLDVNAEWLQLTGLARADVVGRSAMTLGFWDTLAQRTRVLQSLRETSHRCNLDLTFVRQEHRRILLRLNLTRIEVRCV